MDFGEDIGYGNSVYDAELKTSHSMVLMGLQAGVEYHYQVTVEDGVSNTVTSPDGQFVTDTEGGSGVSSTVEDGFDGSVLGAAWTVEDPIGDGSVTLAGGQLSLSVSSGVNHDVWSSGNDALRVMQTAANVDFEMEVKFDSMPSQQYQLQGILVEQDARELLG